MTFTISLVVMFLAACVAGWTWWMISRRPDKWAAMVDRDNDFWARRGLVSPAFAEKIKRAEKGALMKWALGFCTILLMAGVILNTIQIAGIVWRDRARKLPYNPALVVPQKRPAPIPPTNSPPKKPAH